jgi:hypothetical protein
MAYELGDPDGLAGATCANHHDFARLCLGRLSRGREETTAPCKPIQSCKSAKGQSDGTQCAVLPTITIDSQALIE